MRVAPSIAIVTCLLGRLAPLAAEELPFETPLSIHGLTYPVEVAAGELNGDGVLDLVAATGRGAVEVLFQDPADRTRWRVQQLAVGESILFATAADFNGDGRDEIVAVDTSGRGFLLLNRGDGSFEIPKEVEGKDSWLRWAAVGDWNGDGSLDLALSVYIGVSVHLGDGAGNLSFHKLYPATETHTVATADWNADGKLDILVGGGSTGLHALFGSGDGEFRDQTVADWRCTRFITAGDVNADGASDVAVTCALQALGGGSNTDAFIGLSDRDEGVQKRIDLEASVLGGVDGVALADMNADGRADWLYVESETSLLSIRLAREDGSLEAPMSFGSTGNLSAFVIAPDLDGDGLRDVVTASVGSASATILWGIPGDRRLTSALVVNTSSTNGEAAVADMDRDGAPDFILGRGRQATVYVYLGPGMRPSSPSVVEVPTPVPFTRLAVADLDGDGTPDLAGASLQENTVHAVLLDVRVQPRAASAARVGLTPLGIGAAPLGEDAALDLVAPCYGSASVAIAPVNGDGTLAEPRAVNTIDRPKEVAVGDVDGDGRVDMITVSAKAVALHRGLGGGAFSPPELLVEEAAGTKSFVAPVIEDVTRDGLADLLVGETRGKVILVFRGAREGFVAPEEISIGAAPFSIDVVDWTGDGMPDLAIDTNSKSIVFIPGLPESGFGAPTELVLSSPLVARHRILDLTGDAVHDLVVFTPSTALVFLGSGATASQKLRRGDADGDGTVALTDAVIALAGLFQGGSIPCADAADANDDGALDITDAVYLLRWLFQGGPAPPAPGPAECGPDTTKDDLDACTLHCS